MQNIQIDSPWWMIFPGLVIAFLFSYFLYFYKKNEISKRLQYLLFFTRFLSVFIIYFLLLGLLLKYTQSEVKKPVLIVGVDNSASMKKTGKENLQKTIELLNNGLINLVDIKILSFGEKITETPQLNLEEKETDISTFLNYAENNYSNLDIAGTVLLSDGIINSGDDPLYHPFLKQSPVYCIAYGDTSISTDLSILDIEHNKTALLNNYFPVRVTIESKLCNGKNTKVLLKENNVVLSEQSISFSGIKQQKKINFQVEAKTKGLHNYTIEIVPLAGEKNKANNNREIFVEVIESKEKILFIADAPHPDISSILQAFEKSENFELDFFYADKLPGKTDGYSLVIAYQFPSLNNGNIGILQQIKKQNIPVLYFIGTKSAVSLFSSAINTPNLNLTSTKPNEAFAVLNKNFSPFSFDENFKRWIYQLPPVTAPYLSIKNVNISNTLFFQRIDGAETTIPLIYLDEKDGQKQAFILGEGIWKWRMNNYTFNNSFEYFNTLVNKMAMYLSAKEDKRPFKIFTKNIYKENEQIELDAELRNQINELTNEPDVFIDIFDENNIKYSFTFSKLNKAYHLNAGILKPGVYQYKANVKSGNTEYTANGFFRVDKVYAELISDIADHHLLKNISAKSNGKMFFPNQIETLIEALKKSDAVKPVYYYNFTYNDAINMKWIFFLLIVLLGLEWLIRKRSGLY